MAIRSVNLSDTIGELVTEFNLMGTDIGDLSLLTTTDTSSIVAAIASLDSDIRADFGSALDSDLIIQLITDQTNLISIFDSSDFQITDGRVALRDSAARFEIVDDITTNSTFFITLSDQTSGFRGDLNISSTKITFNPSTGILSVNKIVADSATITNLTSTTGTITNLTNTNLTSTTGTITNLTNTNLTSDSATITNLTNTNLTSDSATITTISFANAYGGNIAAVNIDADSAYFTGVVNAQDFNSTSDESLKENIETLNNAIDVVNRIRPVSFTWKNNNQTAYGVIAQEVEEVLPAIVNEDKDHIKRVAYSQLIPFLIQVIQQQDLEIQKIKNVLNLD
jgi:hypothetical protein